MLTFSKALYVGIVLATAHHVPARSHVKPQHRSEYRRAYAAVVRKFGHRAPGRNIVKWGLGPGKPATDAEVVTSISVLHRMLAPTPRVVIITQAAPSTAATATSSTPVAYTATGSGLAGCIISRESSGNIRAVNGQYTGEAQWSPSSWAGGGGTKYAPSPLQATKAQQDAVLNSMLAAGQAGQWTPYDGC